jgi:MFS family permease
VSGRLRGLLLDTGPLRHDRDYRLLWSGQVVSGMGNQVTRLALPFQVYTLTHSTLAIAALTFAQLVPILAFALAAGSLADAIDRRRLLLLTQTGLLLCSLALVGLALTGNPPLPALFAVAFISAGLSAVDQPARGSSVPRLVPAERLPAALALNQLNFQTASIVGPAVGGILIATVGLVGAYLVDVASFFAAFVALLAMRPLPPLGQTMRPGLRAIREGLDFALRHRVILASFVIDLNAMILAMPVALFPAIALDVFRVGPVGLGLLASAPAAGAFLGAILSGWVSRVRRVGRAVVAFVVIWGLAMSAFGLTTLATAHGFGAVAWTFPVALVMLAIAGAADVFSAVFRSTIFQLETPDALRGRVTSIHSLVVTSGPRIGDIGSALAASVVGPGLAVFIGGLLCVAGTAVIARAMPELPRHVLHVRTRTEGAPAPH